MFQFIRISLNEFFTGRLHFPGGLGRFCTLLIILAVTIFIGLVIYQLIRLLFVGSAKLHLKRKPNLWLQAMLEQKFFARISMLLPAFFVFRLSGEIFAPDSMSMGFFKVITHTYIIIMLVRCISAFLEVLEDVSAMKHHRKPIKSYQQVVKIVLWVLAVILIACILVNKSPAGLIAGIGAFSAVLLLVFQDTITGFVNSIQLSSNDMVRIGDWITDPNGEANGIVEEVNLIAVKVRNFDNSIVTVPIKTMVGSSIQNWRGMNERKVRRITRSIHLDVNTLRPCTPEMLEEFKKIDLVRDYINDTQARIEQINRERDLNDHQIPNAEFQTNLGILRAYMVAYLRQHPMVDNTSLLMVRHRAPDENGLPMELYCFVRATEWNAYESLQSDLFDHFYAILPYFHLRAFQRNSDMPSKD